MKKQMRITFYYKYNSNIFIIILLKFIIIFYKIETCLSSDCNYTHPIKKNGGDCIIGLCDAALFESGDCTIENDIIKTQWITSIIEYSEPGVNYGALDTTPFGSLICSSSYYTDSKTTKYYYGLKKNGRPFFSGNGKESSFSSTYTDKKRCEGNIYAIKLNGADDDKEYVIAFGNNVIYFEMYDFIDYKNVTIYKQLGTTFFNTSYNNFQRASIFKLNTSDDYYIISIIAQEKTTYKKAFYVMKLLFTSLEITNYSPIVKVDRIYSTDIPISSCFESENNYIICFFLDSSYNYIAIVYDQELNRKNSTIVSNTQSPSQYIFYKCVHFTGDTGAFLYYDIDDNIAIQFKKYISLSGNIENYFNTYSKIKIINNNYNNRTKTSEMTKLSDKKFCFTVISLTQQELNFFVINSFDENIKIRQYNIKIYNLYYYKITEELGVSLYNGLIAMVSVGRINNGNAYSSIIIFSYPNSTDFDVDITNNLTSFINPIINFYEKCKIENNIFGYVFVGIKIIDITNGLKLSSLANNTEIKKEDILYGNDNAELSLTKDINIEDNKNITFAMVLTEPDYDSFNKYPFDINETYCGNYCENEKNYFQKNLYVGRNSYCNIYFDLNLIKNDCKDINENCALCYSTSCITCKYSYELSIIGEKICLNESESTQTDENNETNYINEDNITNQSTIINYQTNSIIGNIKSSIIENTEKNIESSYIISHIEKTSPNEDIISESITKSENIIISDDIITDNKTSSEIIYMSEDIIKDSITNYTFIYINESISDVNMNTEITYLNEKNQSDTIKNNEDKNISDNVTTEIETDSQSENIIKDINTNSQNEIIKTNNESNCTNEDILKNNCSGKVTVEQINDVKNNILYNNYTKENVIIKTQNIIAQLSKVEDEKNNDEPDISNIDLGECENILKKVNHISQNESLIIFKTDIKTEDISSTYVAYEVYNPITLEILNLNVCSHVEVSINVPIKVDYNFEVLYKSLSDSGYNLLNKSDSFYQDICSKYTTVNGTDILLLDRKKDIYTTSQSENQSMCQSGCEVQFYNMTTKKVKCFCSVIYENNETINEDNIESLFNTKQIEEEFFKVLNNSNFRVLQCYKLVFLLSEIKNNVGQIIMSILLFIFLLLIIIFVIMGLKQINKYINFILQLKNIRQVNNKTKKTSEKDANNSKSKHKKVQPNQKLKVEKNAHTIHNKKLAKTKKQAPPKKDKANNNNHSAKKHDININKTKNNKLSNDLTNKNINNNIILNVQLINSKLKKKKNSLFSSHNKIYNKKYHKKFSIKNNNQLKSNFSGSNTKKCLINNSITLFKEKKNKKIKTIFNPNDYRLLNDYEINNLDYDIAIEIDHRKYIQYYWSLLRQKQLILFTFFLSNDYNVIAVKISLFILSFSLFFTVNGFFFSDKTMHKVYKDNGSYDILYKIPQLIYTTLVSTVINMILKKLSLSEKNILEIKDIKDLETALERSKKIENVLKISYIFFFILSFIFMSFFWYFISCFCAVFSNTQNILIKDTLISFTLSLLYPFIINLVPGIFRIYSLRTKNKDKQCLYKLSQIISLI